MSSWVSIIAGLISVAGAIYAAILTVQLAQGRFRVERWWDRKAEAYERITEALHGLMTISELFEAESSEGSGDELSEEQEEAKDAQRAARWAKFEAAKEDLRRATATGSLATAETVAAFLKQFEGRKKPDPHEHPDFDYYGMEAKAYREALEQVKRLAKNDLGIG